MWYGLRVSQNYTRSDSDSKFMVRLLLPNTNPNPNPLRPFYWHGIRAISHIKNPPPPSFCFLDWILSLSNVRMSNVNLISVHLFILLKWTLYSTDSLRFVFNYWGFFFIVVVGRVHWSRWMQSNWERTLTRWWISLLITTRAWRPSPFSARLR